MVMQLITGIIKPHRLDQVREALAAAGATGMTVTEVKGFGRQGGHSEVYRGAEYRIDYLPKIEVRLLVNPGDVDRMVEILTEAARTGSIGDGKVWVTNLEQVVRVRTGERDSDAI